MLDYIVITNHSLTNNEAKYTLNEPRVRDQNNCVASPWEHMSV